MSNINQNHQCNKEKEITEMGVEVKNIKTTLTRVEEKQDKTLDKLDAYIETANKDFAKNDDVDEKIKHTHKEFNLKLEMIERQNGFIARSVKIAGLDSVWSASTWADSCLLMRCTATGKALVLQFWWALILQPSMLQAWRPCC